MIKSVEKKAVETKILVDTIVDAIQDIKGKDIVILDLQKLPNSVTDYFIICSGESSTQVEGISNSVLKKTSKQLKEKPWHKEGLNNSEWILLDYVNVVVHIFYKDVRSFYNLEGLWADAEITEIPNLD
ncbi:ribosome silencing factor [Paracrocinitomix mangrovi]|uniref:ribosome silencing factor n=1 Tax=Paracrocinitomix mangrovi TaxID=2862509 RepID=UPI001C8D85FA|nr:ribosome silencing factor [Paracrocinitomix mangrovi]UKN01694.1 ribosome silencing factor [Paracrocinitomix mangrovi]